MVYFVQDISGGPIKIGQTGNIEVRLKRLRRDYRSPGLIVLATLDGFEKEEAEMHARFAHLRIGDTEQFRPGIDLTSFLKCVPHPDPDSVEAMPSVYERRDNREFRALAKGPIPGQAPSEICDAIRIRAASERRSHSEVATEILSIGLGIDPLQFGIRPDGRRPRRRNPVHSN